ncbi:MAG: sulfur carrier protein ThiS [Planctomycetales bacterium]|nr:sulfur carrier protein ThiS [Planctomycetales bacterium]
MQTDVVIEFNGAKLDLPRGTSIRDVLAQAEMRTRLVAVELNGEIVPWERFEITKLNNGDIVEAVTLVGGG